MSHPQVACWAGLVMQTLRHGVRCCTSYMLSELDPYFHNQKARFDDAATE